MKTCLILDSEFPPDIRVEKEARALARNHEVTVFCRGESAERTVLDESEVTIIRRQFERQCQPRWLGDAVRRYASYRRPEVRRVVQPVVSEIDPDVVHVHDLPLVRTGRRIADETDAVLLADLHENYPEAVRQWRIPPRWWFRLYPPRILRQILMPIGRLKRIERDSIAEADHVITVAEEARDHYVADCEAPLERVSVISNTVDLTSFDRPTRDPDDEARAPTEPGEEFVITYVGTLSGHHRGIETVLKAVAERGDQTPEIKFLIVGAGGPHHEARLRRTVERLGIDDRVEFTGWINFDRVPRYIAASDVGLVPHRPNGHTNTTVPHKLFQYMAMEKPVVVTDVAPLRRIVSETDSGRVVPAEDPTAMANAIGELAGSPKQVERLGQNGRRAVESTYNWERDGKKLLEVYERVRGTSSRRTRRR